MQKTDKEETNICPKIGKGVGLWGRNKPEIIYSSMSLRLKLPPFLGACFSVFLHVFKKIWNEK